MKGMSMPVTINLTCVIVTGNKNKFDVFIKYVII